MTSRALSRFRCGMRSRSHKPSMYTWDFHEVQNLPTTDFSVHFYFSCAVGLLAFFCISMSASTHTRTWDSLRMHSLRRSSEQCFSGPCDSSSVLCVNVGRYTALHFQKHK